MRDFLSCDGTKHLTEPSLGVTLVNVSNVDVVRGDSPDRVVIKFIRRIRNQADFIAVLELVPVDLRP